MLLIDLSSVVIGGVVSYLSSTKEKLDENLVRSLTLSQVLFYKQKYSKYGRPIICADNKNYWRKDIFPYYKQNRKKARDKSSVDWELFWLLFGRIKEELKNDLPYLYLEVEKAEADDIISVLSLKYASHEPVMIVSSDKDMLQLQLKSKNIQQYSPTTKKQITLDTNDYSLLEHIIKGDSSDGIPNILSDDDVFVEETKRQKSIRKQWIEEAKNLKNPEMICPDGHALDKYKRNRMLISVDEIPEKYRVAIVNEYDQESKSQKSSVNMLKYISKHRLKNFLDRINEF
jgi:5'-3' exonuclease